MMPPSPPPSILLFRPTVEMLHFSRRYFFFGPPSGCQPAGGGAVALCVDCGRVCSLPPGASVRSYTRSVAVYSGTPVRPVRRTVARRTHSPRSQELLPPSLSTQMGRTMGELRGEGEDRTVVGRGSEKRKRPRTSEMGKGRRRGDELTRHFVFRGRAAARGGGGRKQPAPQGEGKKEERRGHFEKEGGKHKCIYERREGEEEAGLFLRLEREGGWKRGSEGERSNNFFSPAEERTAC